VTARKSHCTDFVTQQAAGAIAAQEAIDRARGEESCTPHAWHAFAELVATYGPRSAAAAAFVGELAKRAVGATNGQAI
jgi:hypothetical protein